MGKAMTVGACLVLAGCTGSSEQDPAKEATGRFLGAIAAGNHPAACALLAPRVRESWGKEGCERGLVKADVPGGSPDTVSVWSEEAQVKTGRDTIFLHDFSTGWLITGAGCHLRNEQVYDCEVGGP